MAKRQQSTFYPSDAPSCLNIAAAPFCKKCNTSQNRDCCTSDTSKNGSTNEHTCSAVCNTCQNSCNTVQNYCGPSLGIQLIIQHADTGQYPAYCEQKDEFIFRNWRAKDVWNVIIDNLISAFTWGRLENHTDTNFPFEYAVPDPENSPHPANSLVTAAKYNQVAAMINAWVGTSLPTVQVGDVIRGTHAQLQHKNYDSAKFKTTVCDICNTSAQFTSCPCACDCSCACSCSCGCSCSCNCNCSCSCTCSSR